METKWNLTGKSTGRKGPLAKHSKRPASMKHPTRTGQQFSVYNVSLKLMRSCNAARLHYSQTCSLPVLPFLAPRAFTPWPQDLRPRPPLPDGTKTTNRSKRRAPELAVAVTEQCSKTRSNTRFEAWRGAWPYTSKRHFSSAIVLPGTRLDVDGDGDNKQGLKKASLEFRSPTEARLTPAHGSPIALAEKLDVFEEEDGVLEADDVDLVAQRQKQDHAAQQWYVEMIQEGGEATLYQSWAALTPEMRRFRWLLLANWYIRHQSPEQTWTFIARTLEDISPAPAPAQLQLTLHAATMAVPTTKNKRLSARLAGSMFLALQTCRSSHGTPSFPTSTLCFIASHSEGSLVAKIYDYLVVQEVPLTPSVLFRFAFRFAEHQDLRALDLLTQSALSKNITSSQSVLELCALIVRSAKDKDSPTKSNPEVLSRIMDLGVPLETCLVNAMIQNAVDCNDTETAMRIYSKLSEDRRLRADGTTYLTLLPRLRSSEQLGWFLQVQRDIRARGIQTFDPQVIHELMISRYRQTERYHFELMLGLYEVAFSLQPLKQLGIISENYQAVRNDYAREFCGPLPLPTRPIVELMLHIFSNGQPRRILPIVEVYQNLVRLRNAGVPLFLELARRQSPWTIILKSLCMREATLKAWPQVIRDMESQPLDDEQKPYRHPWTGKPWQPPSASTPRIWNIILNGYARRGLMREAEHILDIMSQRHVEPDMFSFTPLIRGYAAQQNIRGIENTLRHIEVAGHELVMNEHTRKALAPFKDKQVLAKALEDSVKRRRDPYTARPADELFESEEEPIIPGSTDEFQKWDSFAQAAMEEATLAAAKPFKRAARRDAFAQNLHRNVSVPNEEQVEKSEDIDVGTAPVEALQLDNDNEESLDIPHFIITSPKESSLDEQRVQEKPNASPVDTEVATSDIGLDNDDVSTVKPLVSGPERYAQPTPGSHRVTKELSAATQSDTERPWTMNEYLSKANSRKFTRSRGRKSKWFFLERVRRYP